MFINDGIIDELIFTHFNIPINVNIIPSLSRLECSAKQQYYRSMAWPIDTDARLHVTLLVSLFLLC